MSAKRKPALNCVNAMSGASAYSFKRFVWIAVTITALRIIYLFFNHRNLDVEEAQYWTWSQHLALGYHSKPPMISWAIYFCTLIFGNSEWAIRILSPITYFLSALCLYSCGKKLYHQAIGFWSGVTVLFLPGVTYSATIISTDPLLILFWSLALYAFASACHSRRIPWWILCGAAVGLGLLSKYTMLAFFLSAGLFFICSTETSSPLKKPGPYIALIIAILVFLPNAIWNTQHHNAALAHVVQHNIHVQGVELHWRNLGFFLVSQAGILGPVLLVFLLVALLRWRRLQWHESSRLLICFTLPILLLICGEALLSRAYANWAVVAYPSGAILTVAYMWEQKFRRWLKFSVWLHIFTAVVLCGWELAIAYGYCHWPQPDRPNWRDFGVAIAHQHTTYPNLLYLVDNRELWSKTMYYGKVSRDNLFVWDPEHSVDWVDNPAHFTIPVGKDFILISYDAHLPADMAHSFRRYQKIADFPVSQRLLGRQSHIYIYWLQGFYGYGKG